MKKLLLLSALFVSFGSFGQTAEEYFDSAYDKGVAKDFYGAISDFTKAIELLRNISLMT
tara:strand:- start:36 stop:212 length:177 start_codon:yes stop_codon:yes gene_type:complete